MKAIIALCHFCEQHGPSVIMCTQPYRQVQKTTYANQSSDVLADSGLSSLEKKNSASVAAFKENASLNKNGALDSVPNTNYLSSHQQPNANNPTCKSCSSVQRDEPGIVSYDQAANTSYISTQCPKDPELNNFVRNACIRSLSSEVFPGIEGAFYFGDELNGHVMSYNFKISDSQARGNQSRYSILIVSWDRLYLLNLWPFIVSNISRMVSRLRLSADEVFNAETSENSIVSTGMGLSSSQTLRTVVTTPFRRCATPPAALAAVPHGQAIAAGTAVATGSGGGEGQGQKRAMDPNMRSLIDLTKDDQIFYRIHAWFTWLLRAGGRRWSVVPSFTAPPGNEDALIGREEHQALIAAGVEQMGSNAVINHHKISVSALSQTSSSNISNLGVTFGSSIVVPNIFYLGPNKILDLGCISTEQQNILFILVLTRLFATLGRHPFSRLVQHLAVGNQVVVQPLCESMFGLLVLNALAKLLPKGCVKQVSCSREYLPPFRSNLLSLMPDVACADFDGTTPNDGVLFLAVYSEQPKQKSSDVEYEPTFEDGDNNEAVAVECDNDTSGDQRGLIDEFVNLLHFRLSTIMPSHDPDLLQLKQLCQSNNDVNKLLTNQSIAVAARGLTSPIPVSGFVDQLIQMLSIQPPLDSKIQLRALETIKNEWINRARLLYSFKRCQGPTLGSEDATRRWSNVLSSIGCSSPENASVVRFWQGALSQHSRNHVCHIRRHRTASSANTSRRASCSSSNADLSALVGLSSVDFGGS